MSYTSVQTQDMTEFQKQKQTVVDLLTAAENGDVDLLKTTMEVIRATAKKPTTHAEILAGYKDGNKRTALHFAAAKGRRKMVKFILETSPETLNLQDEDGATALFLSARENEFTTTSFLLENGADPKLVQKNGTSALHEAAANGSLRTIRLLLEQGLDVNLSGKNGTALHFAVNESREKTIEELIKLGANVNAQNDKGVTPLLLSCMLNKPVLVKALLAAHADTSVALNGGITALHIAAEAGFTAIVEELLAVRHDETVVLANTQFNGGATPLQLAAGKGHTQIVAMLQPITKGYESVNVEQLMATEKAKMDKYLVEATKSAPIEEIVETEEEKAKKKLLEGVIPENEIVVPESKPVDAETQTKATALKDDGNTAFVAKDFAKAIELYSQAIALTPADGVLYSNRCAAYLGAGDAKKALNDVRLAKKLKKGWSKAHFREGQCLEALGLYEDAACAMWEAIQLDPKNRALEKRFQDCVAKGREHHKNQSA